jgi:uncharacterized protein
MPMPTQVSYPGVYIEEIPSGVRTITGVATSITAFIGSALKGPVNEAMTINSYADFERIFGGLWLDSTLGYAVRDFYLNGGSQAIVVRLFHLKFAEEDRSKAETAAKEVADAAKAKTKGSEAKAEADRIKAEFLKPENNKTQVEKDAATAIAADIGKLPDNTDQAAITKAADAAVSKLLLLSKVKLSFGGLKLEAAYEGAWGMNLRAKVDLDNILETTLFNLTVQDSAPRGTTERFLNLSVQNNSPRRFDNVLKSESKLVRVDGSWAAAMPNLSDIRTKITELKAAPSDTSKQDALWGLTQDTITQAESKYARAKIDREKKQNDGASPAEITAAKAAEEVARLALDAAKKAVSEAISDGLPLTINDFLPLEGETKKEGMYALERVDLFNLLCIPPYKSPDEPLDIDLNLISAAATYCEKRRAMLLVDPPKNWIDKSKARQEFSDPIEDKVGTRSRNAALFFPRLKQPNPLHENQIEEFVPCGVVAGIFARTDTQRGVWKAPAGLDATLVGVPQLAVNLTDPENGELNPLGINCLRAFPVVGRVVWGSRTLKGADQLADEYKYIPVRRLALYIEESLYRGTQWVVFEPNDEPLWAQIRLNLGAFMNNLFRQGAFQGRTPQEAYFVKCSSETTTQNDINLGIVNIVVGFAPLKPAEFVIIKLQQIAGQIAT